MIDKNIPNYLTLARIFVIPIIVLTFYFEDSILAHQVGAALFTLAAITDFIDGYLARRYDISSSFGQMMDPVADKLLVGCVIVMLVKYNKANEIPAALILARELVVAGLREFLAEVRVSVPVTWLAKVKTFTQMVAITILIWGNKGSGFDYTNYVGQGLFWIAAVLTIFTGYSYFKACSRYFQW